MKNVPNFFTLLNLVFGCIAIVLILQTAETIAPVVNGVPQNIVLPERIVWGALFIFGAAVVDFLDGFLARALKAPSEMGKQLDSLSDVVSFGVAPGMILYQLLRMSYAREESGLDVSIIALLPAFVFSSAVAWRLATFNISADQKSSFRGVPSPAAGLVVASLPLIIWYEYYNLQRVLINEWVLYAVIILLSYLMLSNHRFMALKFTNFSFKNNRLKYFLLLISLISIIRWKWLAVPLIFILYILLSFLSKEPEYSVIQKENQPIT